MDANGNRTLLVGALLIVAAVTPAFGTAAVRSPSADATALQAPSDFVVRDVQAPSGAAVGQEITVRATVENTGGTKQTSQLQYRLDGQVRSTVALALDPGATATISFTITVPPLDPGTYTHGVYVGRTDEGQTAQLQIRDERAEFRVTGLQAPSSANSGDRIDVRATITNVGTARGSTRVEYRLDGRTLASRTVDLDAGASTIVPFSIVVPALGAGTYTHGMFVGSTNEGQTASIRIDQTRPEFRVVDLRAPSIADSGEEITVRATVVNVGTARGSTRVEYRFDGRTLASRTVDLGAGTSTSVSFAATLPDRESGSYRHGVFVGSTDTGQSTTIRIAGQPRFRVTDLDAPSRAEPGERIRVEARITNTGTERGTTDVEYRIGGRVVSTDEVAVSAGSSRTVVFSVRVPTLAAGRYTQGVFIDDTDSGRTSTLAIAGEPVFGVSDLRSPARATVGDRIVVQATVANTGSRSGSTTVEYRFDGAAIASRTVDLDAGERTTVVFDVAVPDRRPGTYTQGVFVRDTGRGQTASMVVEGRAPAFGVSDFRGPDEAVGGEQVTAQATVRNAGTGTGTATVEYRIDGETIATRRVTLAAGETATVTFTTPLPLLGAGRHTQGVFLAGTDQGPTAPLRIREAEPSFDVSNLRAPAEATVGDRITVRATVANTGSGAGSTEVEYRIGDTVVDATTVDLDPGRSTTVTFAVAVPDQRPGTYRHGVFVGDTNRGETSSLVIVGGEPSFNVFNIRAPAEATVGDRITVRATIVNTGTGPGSETIEYRIGGSAVASQTVDLAPGASTTVSFAATVPDVQPGVHQHGVFVGDTDRGGTSSIVVRARETPTEQPVSTPGFGFAAAAGALAVLAAIAARRRRAG